MPVFEYKGTTAQGRPIRGVLQAVDQQTAKDQLKKDRIYLFEIKSRQSKDKPVWRLWVRRRVDIKTLCNMTRLLATLLKSSVPLVESLTALTKQISHPVLGPALVQIRNNINEGQPFYKSLRQYPHIFNTTYISMCEAGESSGTLDIVLLKLAEFTEDQADLTNKIRSTLAYPALIIFFTCGVMLFLFTYIIPKITTLLEEEEALIPWHTALVMASSKLLIKFWLPILVISGLVVLLFMRWTKTTSGQRIIDHISLQLPLLGSLIRAAAISRFSRTLSVLLNGGVPMLTSFSIVQNVVNNVILRQAIHNASLNIREGESIASPLQESQQFPPMTIQMIKVGEKTGQLEDMLLRISEAYDFQVRTEVNTLTSILGPAMIIIMGGVVAIVIFSVMVPLLEMYNQIS